MMAPRAADQNATPPDWFYERTDAPEHLELSVYALDRLLTQAIAPYA